MFNVNVFLLFFPLIDKYTVNEAKVNHDCWQNDRLDLAANLTWHWGGQRFGKFFKTWSSWRVGNEWIPESSERNSSGNEE